MSNGQSSLLILLQWICWVFVQESLKIKMAKGIRKTERERERETEAKWQRHKEKKGIKRHRENMKGRVMKEGLNSVYFRLTVSRSGFYFNLLLKLSPLDSARGSNRPILKEINLEYSLEDWCWSWSSNALATWCEEPTHWKRPWYWERLRAGGEAGTRIWSHHRLDGQSLSKFREIVMDREAWHAAVHRVAKSRTRLSNWMTNNNRLWLYFLICQIGIVVTSILPSAQVFGNYRMKC